MKKKLFSIFIILTMLMSMVGCDNSIVNVNVENAESLSSNTLGKSNFIKIGNGLYYDYATGIVFLQNWNTYGDTYVPYPAPNGLPYRYNQATNTFEEINNCCEHCALNAETTTE